MAVLARSNAKALRAIKAVDWEAEHYEEISVVIVACLRWTAYGPVVSGIRPPFPPFLAGIYYGSIFPAVQNLLLAARAVGLGASLTIRPLCFWLPPASSTPSRILSLLDRETGKARVDTVAELLLVCLDIGYLARRARRALAPERQSPRPVFGKRALAMICVTGSPETGREVRACEEILRTHSRS